MNTGDDLPPPPPPYSETDIYSNAGSGRRTSAGVTPHPLETQRHAALSQSSTSLVSPSSGGVVGPGVPPPTALTPGGNSESLFLASEAAHAYFESRPLQRGSFQDHHVTHTIRVTSASRPGDFPYPPQWADRDITLQDWNTFLNFLLPNHTTASNEALVERMHLAKMESMAAAPSPSERTHASSQLQDLRGTSSEAATPSSSAGAQQEASAVTAEWNHEFFQPRAVWIRLADGQSDPTASSSLEPQRQHLDQVPGSSDQYSVNAQHRQHQQPPAGPYQLPPHPPPPSMMHHPYTWGPPHPQHPYHSQPAQSKSGFNFAGIRMNDDSLSIGRNFVADRNGVRLGALVADTNGLRYGDNVVVGHGMFDGRPSSQEYPGAMYHGGNNVYQRPGPHPGSAPPVHPVPTPGTFFPGPRGPVPGPFPGPLPNPALQNPSSSQHGQHRSSLGLPGPSDAQSYNRMQPSPRPPSKPPSEASTTSSTAISTSSSIGTSLPAQDDLNDPQLIVVRSQLRGWVERPDHVTKQDVRRLKAELHEVKLKEREYPPENIDRRALEAEVKGLKQEWRALMRTQRGIRREWRRDKRAKKRAERKERREKRKMNEFKRSGDGQENASRGRSSAPESSWGVPPLTAPSHPDMTIGMGPERRMGQSMGPPPSGIGMDVYRSSSGPSFSNNFGHPQSPWGGDIASTPPFGFGPGFDSKTMPGVAPWDHYGRGEGGQVLAQRQQTQGEAWRQGQEEQEVRIEAVPAHEKSQAKFKQLDELEKELARKFMQLDEEREGDREGVQDKDKENVPRAGTDSGVDDTGGSRGRLESEVDKLTRRVEVLRMEADEAFARELEEQERRGAGGS